MHANCLIVKLTSYCTMRFVVKTLGKWHSSNAAFFSSRSTDRSVSCEFRFLLVS